MDIYLIRHAIAVPWEPGIADSDRPLSPEGRLRWVRCVRGLERLGARFDLLLHSPLLRAVETAEVLQPLVEGKTRTTPNLAAAPDEELLAELDGADSAGLVGHEPWMGDLLSLLLGAQVDAPFKKGGVAWLRGEPRPGGAYLAAVMPPKVLVRMGRMQE